MTNHSNPFLPWVGGKRSVADHIIPHIPSGLNTYYEPFLGGGALFFRVKERFRKHALSDINLRLTISYNAVKKAPEAVIAKLKEHGEKDSKDYYFQLQAACDHNDPVEAAAKFIYLVSQAFYGLYRVAKNNDYTMSYRTQHKLPLSNLSYNIANCSVTLKDVSISVGDFSFIEPTRNDFVYLDPPYHKSGEKMYTPCPFDEKEQIRLKNFVGELDVNSTKFALSNSDTPFIRDLYKGYEIKEIKTRYKIGRHRPVKTELLITNT